MILPCSWRRGAEPPLKRISGLSCLHRLCGTIEAELITLSTTGTNSEVAASDQIRPIATTIPIPIHPMRICIPHLGEIGLA
jgi:hypothetical protein